jgi:hypothetical protein
VKKHLDQNQAPKLTVEVARNRETYLSRSVPAPLLLLKRSTSTGKSFGDMNLEVVEPKK